MWRFVMPQLAAGGYTVLAPDLRGLGDTAKPATGYDKATELAYRVHRLLVAAREGELAIPHGVDRGAVRRFVDDVFFTTQFLDEDIHSEGKARASRPLDRSNVTQGLPATGVVGDSETTDRESDVCRPNSGAGGAETPNSESGIDTDAEARRIAAELVRLHEAGVIKSEEDASFYANLVHRFGASFTACVGPHVPKQGAPNGFTVPEPGNTHADSRLAVGRSFNRV
jgi:hypothetical protein